MPTPRLAARMRGVHRSFIREILKITADPRIISFAGGLPCPEHFPAEGVAEAARAVLAENGPQALQYSTSEGHPELREWIAARYARRGLVVEPDEIVVTTGSQQGLDLLGKVFLDPGDTVLVERPGYLGAIQAFSLMGGKFTAVELEPDGVDVAGLAQALSADAPKLYYTVPNFQNPSGISFSAAKRKAAAAALDAQARENPDAACVLVEDDPYGELRFAGQHLPYVASHLEVADAVQLGSFSKIVAPGLRVGWLRAPKELVASLVTAKQAADLHTSTLCQRILSRFLADADLDAHIARIVTAYGERQRLMLDAIGRHFPSSVSCTRPEGGMFLWATLPDGLSSRALFDRAIAEQVAFVPGTPFATDGGGDNALRLNFSNAAPERIEEGIRRLGRAMAAMLGE